MRRGSDSWLRSRPDAASTRAGRASRTADATPAGSSPPAMPAGTIRFRRRAISSGAPRAGATAPGRGCPLEQEVRCAGGVPRLGAAQRGAHGMRAGGRCRAPPDAGPRARRATAVGPRSLRAECRAAGRGSPRSSQPHDRSRPHPARGTRGRVGSCQGRAARRAASEASTRRGLSAVVTNPAKSASAATAARTPASLRSPHVFTRARAGCGGKRGALREGVVASSARRAAGSFAARSAVPISAACAPAAATAARCAGSERPLSATTVAPAALAAAMRSRVASRSTARLSRSRALTPTRVASSRRARSSSVAVWTSTSASIPASPDAASPARELVVRQGPCDQEHGTGAQRSRLPDLVRVDREVLAQHRQLEPGWRPEGRRLCRRTGSARSGPRWLRRRHRHRLERDLRSADPRPTRTCRPRGRSA